jgi:phenylacetate-CoA ligase
MLSVIGQVKVMLATPDLIQETAQRSRLEELLPEWKRVPLYHTFLAQRPVGPDILAALKDFPLTGKREMREGFPFLPPGQKLETLLEQEIVELEHTSGTSEEQLPVLFKRGWWDAQEERALRLNPLVARVLDAHSDARRATLTTPACNGRVCFSAWRARAHRTIGKTLYVNQQRIPFVLTDDNLAGMAEEIADWSPKFLDTDPVHAAWFALYCERKGIRFPSLEFVLCSYEFVSTVHRRIIERAFGVPVFNLYGSTETGHLLMEDGQGKMKPCYDNAFLEITTPDTRGIGDLVVTTLTNDYMPLLRYRIGDLVERSEQPYETTYIVHGRARDAIRDGYGRRVTTWDVDQCFKDVNGIAHYQLQQSADGISRVRYLPDTSTGAPDAGELKGIVARLEALLQTRGPIEVESVEKLPPTPSGKFRLTIGAGRN